MAKKKAKISSKANKTKSKPKTSKNTKSKKSDKGLWKKFWTFLFKVFIICFLLLSLFLLTIYLGFWGPMPSREQLEKVKNPVASEVISQDGRLLGRFYIENRSNVRFEEISPNIINALIATEDSRFYQHSGVDEIALLRVFVKSILLQNRSAGGGSTLSQQIAKNLFPRKNFGPLSMPINKFREAIIAYRLEHVYTKEEILTLYLNTVPFSENTYGIEVASERFFSKSPVKLTVCEAATLIGTLKATNSYNPRKYPERSIERRNIVIDQMIKNGYLSDAEGKLYKAEPITLKYNPITYNQGPAPYLMERLRPFLINWCNDHLKSDDTPYNLYIDGLKIHTTIDYDMQIYAEKAIQEHMKDLQNIFDHHWGNQLPWGNDRSVLERALKRSETYQRLKGEGMPEEEIIKIFSTKRTVTIFTWNGIKEIEMTPLDSIKHHLKLLNSGFMAMNPRNGEVKAYIGGNDFRIFKYDHILSKRQVGSVFKPVIYLAALENGILPDSYFSNEQKVYKDYNNWSPRNSHEDYDGYYSMEGALAKSINTVAVDVLMKTGISNVIDVAERLGIETELPEYPSLALGVASISLENIVTLYSEFVNGGKTLKPYILTSIDNSSGKIIEQFENNQPYEQVVDPENCRMLIRMLESVVNSGTGKTIRSVYGIESDFAGKTGTTQDQADGWFVGMSPDLVAVSWVGGEDPSVHFRTITYGQGGYMALPIVGKFFKSVLNSRRFDYMKQESFDAPNERSIAMMNIEPFIESLNERQGFPGKILAKDDKEDPGVHIKSDKKKKSIWQSIKSIFKKK